MEVTLHNMGSILRAKKITASITQYAEAWVSSRAVYRRATVLDKSEHLPKVWDSECQYHVCMTCVECCEGIWRTILEQDACFLAQTRVP